jgi:V-type H+-transporting ATPase subunit a
LQLNPEVNSFQRMFVRDIRRFDEMERKLRFLEAQVRKDQIPIVDNTWGEECEAMSHQEINHLEQTLIDLERDVINMNESDIQLKRNFLELKEWEAVLDATDQFFEGGIGDAAMQEIEGQEAHETEAGFTLQTRADKEPM